jgi:hypothetical protein
MLLPSAHELGIAYSLHDFAGVPGLVLWCAIVLFPLTGIDRRDACAGYTYTLFCVAVGVILMMALPLRLIGETSTVGQLLLLTGLGLAAGLRWWFRPDRRVAVPVVAAEKKRKAQIRKEVVE